MKGLMGKKIGMTQIFDESGVVTPVTVLEVTSNVITQVKTDEKEGYSAIQVGYGEIKENNLNKPVKGHLDKAGVSPKRTLQEFKVESAEGFEAGQELKADIFSVGDNVDVTGISKGKGFQGSIKRHNFSRGPMTHGSHFHRSSGSMGAASDPARVFKGKKLPGHMGSETVTIQNLEVVKVDVERNLLIVKGAVPGPKKGMITINESIKQGK